MQLPNPVGRLRRPEYTGENRCLLCTVVNLALAAVVAAAVVSVTGLAAGSVVLAAALWLVYVRGYLVPGTPALTARYLPAWVLRRFGKEPLRSDGVGTTGSVGNADDASLVAAGVLTRSGDDLDVTAAFAEQWARRSREVAAAGVDGTAVRNAFDADECSETGTLSYVLDGDTSVRWGSTAALAADVAAADLLDDAFGGWEAPLDRGREVLLGLRLCLDDCPDCGGPVTVAEDQVDPCCQPPHDVAESVCQECGAALADAAVVAEGCESSVHTRLLRP